MRSRTAYLTAIWITLMKSAQKNATRKRATDLDIAIGARVRAARKRAGLSQADIAGKLEITLQQFQKYEKGINRISAASLFQIADFFELSVLDFYFDIPVLPSSASELSESEAMLLAAFRRADFELQDAVRTLIFAAVT
jgi:transcriptional regulator with XRE-family HTH domain